MNQTNDRKKVVILVGSGNRAKILAVKNAFIPLIPYLHYFQRDTKCSSKTNFTVEDKNRDGFFLHLIISSQSTSGVHGSNEENQSNSSLCSDNETILIEFVGISVESGISDQPFTDEETKLGALNRARNAISSVINDEKKDINSENVYILFAVGLEGGVQKQFREMESNSMNKVTANQSEVKPTTNGNSDHILDKFELECYAWMCIIEISSEITSLSSEEKNIHNNERYISYARTASFMLPRKIKELMIEQNLELGHADDLIFKRTDSKSKDGVVGLLTKGVIDRSLYYSHALSLALIPFLSHEVPDLY